MTAEELISILRTHPPDAVVYVCDQYDYPTEVEDLTHGWERKGKKYGWGGSFRTQATASGNGKYETRPFVVII